MYDDESEYEEYIISDRPAMLPIGAQVSASLHCDARYRPCLLTPDGWRLCERAVIIKSIAPISVVDKVLARFFVRRITPADRAGRGGG